MLLAGFLQKVHCLRLRCRTAGGAATCVEGQSLSASVADCVKSGQTMAEQEDDAVARAHAFFDANFPDGFMETTNRQVNVDVNETAYRTRTVFVAASADVNAFFMRAMGVASTTVRVEGKASRRDVNSAANRRLASCRTW